MTKVCVIGSGRVGLPLALVCADVGHNVKLVDVDKKLLSEISRGISPFYEPGLTELLKRHVRVSLDATSSLKEGIEASDFILVTIGTGVKEEKPDIGGLVNFIDELTHYSLEHKTIILKTTLPLGVTERISGIIESKTGLYSGKDFFIGFCPERIVEGRAIAELKALPKIVGGVNDESTQKIADFIFTLGGKVIKVKNSTAAEFVKLMDNAYRVTRFGFANDIAHIAELYQLDAFEIIDAANESYERNNIPYPSCGVGGYCLTKDPLYLEDSFKAANRGTQSVWYAAWKSNNRRVEHTANQVADALKIKGIDTEASRILICGITYKENIDDIRESHGLSLARCLQQRAADISILDPWIYQEEVGFKVYSNAEEAFRGKDAAVFTVPHKEFNEMARSNGQRIEDLVALMRTPILIDGWGIFRKIRLNNSIIYGGTGLPNAIDGR
ncbi:MAG: nucleotide sugar dehydrogenase [Chloroflexota bacterium]